MTATVVEYIQTNGVDDTHALVLASSFNPPTVAHVAMLQTALAQQPRPTLVILALSVSNADKGTITNTEIEKRLEWMKLLLPELSSSGRAVVLLREAPLFIQKWPAIQKCFPLKTCTFLVGDDTLERIFSRKYYPDLNDQAFESAFRDFFNACRFLVFPRTCIDYSVQIETWGSGIMQILPDETVDLYDVSSSLVRQLLQEKPPDWKERLNALLPKSIYDSLIPRIK
jgi:nicotinic acid mononucleotide adenylyltransferase